MRVPVLFCEKDTIYHQLNCDVFDIDRNAITYNDDKPVIAHPPCRSWCKLKHFSKGTEDEKLLAVWAVDLIRKNGGVLEHPEGSFLWPFLKLPKPGYFDCYGGFSICVNQSWFGHRAKKKTMLYICGTKKECIPSCSPNFNMVEYALENKKKSTFKKRLPKKERVATPLPFALFLIEMVKTCNSNLIWI